MFIATKVCVMYWVSKDNFSQYSICKQMLNGSTNALLSTLYAPKCPEYRKKSGFTCVIWLKSDSPSKTERLDFDDLHSVDKMLLMFYGQPCPGTSLLKWGVGALRTPGQVFIFPHSSTLTFLCVLGIEYKNSQSQDFWSYSRRQNTVVCWMQKIKKKSVFVCILIRLTILETD